MLCLFFCISFSVTNLAENPLDLADFASVWRKIFAFEGQRIFMQVLEDEQLKWPSGIERLSLEL